MQRLLETKGSPAQNKSDLPADAVGNIAAFIPDMKGLARLSNVNKHYRQTVLNPHFTKFGLFTHHFSFQAEPSQPILLESKLTPPHVRAGNQLLLEAIKKIKSNTPHSEVDTLIYTAMYRHGSPLAMQFVKMFSTLPGRCQLSYDIDQLINLYTERTQQALETEYKLHFSSSVFDEIESDLRSARGELQQLIACCIQAYKTSYYPPASKRFSEHFDRSLQKELSAELSEFQFKELTFKNFDASGFIGSDKPKSKTAWYLNTNAQKEFMHLQKIIEDSFNDSNIQTHRGLFLK